MAQRTSSMGSKTRLARMLSQERITGTDQEVAFTHEINRQSAVKEILLHVFMMSKFDLIGTVLTVGEARSQYLRARGTDQAAHCAPGQIFHAGIPIQQLIPDDDLELTVENLFAKTDAVDARFNKADSRAEENGLRAALRDACNTVAQQAKNARFNRAVEFYPHIHSAFNVYRTAGVRAFRQAAVRQQTLATAADAASRGAIISILNYYSNRLSTADSSLETVLGLFPEDVWRAYAAAR